MKYISYIYLALITVLRKVFGLVWYWVIVWFRGYARNAVYNYILDNNLFLKRLRERNPTWNGSGYILTSKAHPETNGGYIKYRKVSWLEYKFAYHFIWGWVDDDSYYDTFSKGHNETYISGERYAPKFVVDSMAKDSASAVVKGCTFDIGDKRADFPMFGFWSALIWNGRNSAYNFEYMESCTNDASKVFLFKIGKMQFGWVKDGMLNGVQTYKMRVGINF